MTSVNHADKGYMCELCYCYGMTAPKLNIICHFNSFTLHSCLAAVFSLLDGVFAKQLET